MKPFLILPFFSFENNEECIRMLTNIFEWRGSLMDNVSASQPRDCRFEPHTGQDNDSSYDTITGWFQEADSRVIKISCENLLHNRAKINMLNPNIFVCFYLYSFVL